MQFSSIRRLCVTIYQVEGFVQVNVLGCEIYNVSMMPPGCYHTRQINANKSGIEHECTSVKDFGGICFKNV